MKAIELSLPEEVKLKQHPLIVSADVVVQPSTASHPAKLERVGESFNLKNRIETRLVAGNGHGKDVKAVKALEMDYEDKNGELCHYRPQRIYLL